MLIKRETENGRYDLRHRQRLYLIPLGDLHIGSMHTDMRFLRYALRTIKRIKSPKRIYLMGDLIEVADKKVGDSVYQQDMNVEDQLEEIVRLLKPLRDDIIVLCEGNHEYRLLKEYGFDISRIIANALNVEKTIQYYETILINDKRLRIFATHGAGSSKRVELAISKIRRDTTHIEADIYFYGHLHFVNCVSEAFVNGGDISRRYYVLTGHFLGYDDHYPERQLLHRESPGFHVLGVNKDCNVDVKTYYSDRINY